MSPKTLVQSVSPAAADLIEAYRRDQEALRTRRPLPEPLRARAAAAFQRFSAAGVPHPRLEAWRRTDLGPIRTQHHALAKTSTPPPDIGAWTVPDAHTFLVVDGALVETDPPSPDGVSVHVLAPEGADAALVQRIGTLANDESPERALWALNTAFLDGGVAIRIEKDAAVPGVLHVLHVSTGRPTTVRHPRTFIEVGPGARATVVESFAASGAGAAWTNALTEVDVAANATLTHVRLLREPETALHTGALTTRVGRDATYKALSFTLGAARARHDLEVRLADVGATAHLNGVFLAAGTQHVDLNTFIDHAKPHGTSREDVKGILTGHAHGVFTGNVRVQKDAQQTSSEQENRNLLLSRHALVDTTPQLEILADDVKCSHGSTIGRLDERQLFYLRSRGLPADEARRLLTVAFAERPMQIVDHDGLRGALRALVSEWFTARVAEGGA